MCAPRRVQGYCATCATFLHSLSRGSTVCVETGSSQGVIYCNCTAMCPCEKARDFAVFPSSVRLFAMVKFTLRHEPSNNLHSIAWAPAAHKSPHGRGTRKVRFTSVRPSDHFPPQQLRRGLLMSLPPISAPRICRRTQQRCRLSFPLLQTETRPHRSSSSYTPSRVEHYLSSPRHNAASRLSVIM